MIHFQPSAFLPRVSCHVPGPTVTHSHAFAWRKWTLQRFLSSRPLLNRGSAYTGSRMLQPRSILLWALSVCCSARPVRRPLFPRMRTNLEDSLHDSDIAKTSLSHRSKTWESEGIFGQWWFSEWKVVTHCCCSWLHPVLVRDCGVFRTSGTVPEVCKLCELPSLLK